MFRQSKWPQIQSASLVLSPIRSRALRRAVRPICRVSRFKKRGRFGGAWFAPFYRIVLSIKRVSSTHAAIVIMLTPLTTSRIGSIEFLSTTAT